MTRRELIKIIHDKTNMRYEDVIFIFDEIFNEIKLGLETEDKVTITNFGTFEKYFQEGYDGLNPQTGSPIKVQSTNKIRFSACKSLKNQINK